MLKKSKFMIFCYYLGLYITNRIVNYIPVHFIRLFWYKCCGMKVFKHTRIHMGQYFLSPYRIKIGDYTHINQGCILDARAGITIGNSVSISHRVVLMTGSHDINSPDFKYKGLPIKIGDYAFVGVNATILQGVTIGKGAVVCAGAVVNKDVPDSAVVAGVPAKIIGYRNIDFDYLCTPDTYFL